MVIVILIGIRYNTRTHTHTLLEKHTTDVHDYNEREQLKDKTKVTMVIYLDYNVKRLQ